MQSEQSDLIDIGLPPSPAPSPSPSYYSPASEGTITSCPLMTTPTNPPAAARSSITSYSTIPSYTSVIQLLVGTFFIWRLRLTTLLGVLKLRQSIETGVLI